MKKTDLAYTAGVIEGDGSICICKHQNRHSRCGFDYLLTLQVQNTNEWLCQWLKFAFGGSIGLTTRPKHKAIWCWTVASLKARDVLILILPYLKIKRPQAELAVSFQSRKRMVGRLGKSNKALVIEEAEYILMKRMHQE